MSEVTLVLGPITFKDFEISAGIRFGGRQRVAVHPLFGGGRVVDILGRDDAEIQLEGIFTGSDATLRACLLDELRTSGMSIPLTWDIFFYTVIVREFQANYQNTLWIPYVARCTVLRDEAAAVADQVVSLTAAVAADVASGTADALQAGLALSFASPSVPTVPELTIAQSQVESALTSTESTWNPSATDSATSASAGVAALTSALTATENLAQLSTASGYIGRALTNASIPSLVA
jgi:hypothetical protein